MRALKTKCDRLLGKGTNALAPTYRLYSLQLHSEVV
jgi:hypothetical protein